MSTSKQSYWQPAGLSALQITLANIMKKRIEGDEKGAFLGLKDFALVTANADIIEISEKIAKEIENNYQIQQAPTGITLSETYIKRNNEAEWLSKQNYEYLKVIMILCDKHGITVKHPRDVSSNRGSEGSQLFET
jgi:hypothetical protein